MRHQLLDHGYIELVESWGSDERIIEAARMSTDKGFQGWGLPPEQEQCSRCGVARCHAFNPDGSPRLEGNERLAACAGDHAFVSKPGDEKLLRYLWEHKHATPFEMAGVTIEVQAPIFVFREWHRHRVPFGYNELSARYTPMPDINYVPALDRAMLGSDGKNKQAGTIKGADALTEENASRWLGKLGAFYEQAEQLYQLGLQIGVPKELARLCVPVGRYSRMRATGNLRGWLGFLALRAHPAAQWEIRQYAIQLQGILAGVFPRTLALFSEGQGK